MSEYDSFMSRDDSPEAAFSRVDFACHLTLQAIKRGLQTADHLHAIAGWSSAADVHLHREMTRRDAMEDLKQLRPELEDGDNLGLAMSGLILHLPEDTIRVWYTSESFIPTPDSQPKRRFVSQKPERARQLFDVTLPLDWQKDARSEPNHLIIQWTAQGQELLRFDLVRPCGYTGARVDVDWRRPLLTRYPSVADLTFRRRDEGTGSEEADA
jgi:hypothetical protein